MPAMNTSIDMTSDESSMKTATKLSMKESSMFINSIASRNTEYAEPSISQKQTTR